MTRSILCPLEDRPLLLFLTSRPQYAVQVPLVCATVSKHRRFVPARAPPVAIPDQTSIGKWKGIERAVSQGVETDRPFEGHAKLEGGEHPLLSGDVLVFDRGQKCWNGPTRSLKVELACGMEEILSAVTEPETCTYTAVLETPAACSLEMRNALLAGSSGVGGSDGSAGLGVTAADKGSQDEL